MEIADIFLMNNRTKRGNEMLDIIKGVVKNPVIRKPVIKKTIYTDSQNTHNKDINKSVLKAAHHLIKKCNKHVYDETKIRAELIASFPKSTKNINSVFNRIEIDTAKFNYEANTFSLYKVFSNIWCYINNHKHQIELKKRLIEEINSMALYCSTGHLSRLINVIQGYTTEPELNININDKDQIHAVVTNLLQKELKDAPEEVLDSMIEDDNTLFINFVIKTINKNIPKLVKEYGSVYEHILSATISYTCCDKLKIKNNIILI